MKIDTIQLNQTEWDQFHSQGDPFQIFEAITTALQRAAEGRHSTRDGQVISNGTWYDQDLVPEIAYRAIVFFQAFYAFDGGYDCNNPFHGVTRDGETQLGYLQNVRALRDFMTALDAREWDDALAETIAAAEAIPAADWSDSYDFFWSKDGCKLSHIFLEERHQNLITLDILNKAAAYVQQNCPISR